MMNVRRAVLNSAVIAVGAIALAGCATKDYVNEHVATVDARVTATQSQVDRHETHLTQLDQATKDALDRATAAGKLAEGKFLYSMVLSDDSVKFPIDSSKLSPEAQQRLTDFAEKLKTDNRNVYVEIQGHTDGARFRRAQHQAGRGAGRSRSPVHEPAWRAAEPPSTISYGKADPVADNKTKAGRAQNRRVVLIVMS